METKQSLCIDGIALLRFARNDFNLLSYKIILNKYKAGSIMKILAIEKEVSATTSKDFQPHLKAEAQKVWELQQQNIIREIYFRADLSSAVLILECDYVDDAEKILQTLPLVQANLIEFEIIPLKPYPGFERLFDKNIGY